MACFAGQVVLQHGQTVAASQSAFEGSENHNVVVYAAEPRADASHRHKFGHGSLSV
jgi:hypothetical protein